LLIIPGIKTTSIPLIKGLFSNLAKQFNVDHGHDNWAYDFKKHFQNESDIETIIYEWPRGFSRLFSLYPGINNCATFFQSLKHYDNITILAKSMGCVVAKKAIRKSKPNNISKLIYVATPHRYSKIDLPESIKLINVYSKQDSIQIFANYFFHFGRGTKVLHNAENIEIKNVKHIDFNQNKIIKYKQQEISMFDFYTNLVNSK